MEKNSVVLYKNQAATINDRDGEKYIIRYCSQPASPGGKKAVYSEQKVREKDFILLSQEPVSSLENLLSYSDINLKNQIKEIYELLQSDESTQNQPISFTDLISFVSDGLKPDAIWYFYSLLISELEFNLSQEELKKGNLIFIPRSSQEIEDLLKKQYEKEHESEIRAAFIQRLKDRKLNLPDDAKYMGEVEAYALCKTDKCRALQEAGIALSIEKAHKVLIETGIWDYTKNPYPTRFGFSFDSAREQLGAMPEEEREDCPCTCYAIDSESSTDPDDAVGFDGEKLWVCIADPASSVLPDSSTDIAARGRGTTLYIPEGASRMLAESCLEDYALGLREDSKALAFCLKLDEQCVIEECQIKRVNVKVKRMTYKEAEEKKDSEPLKKLFEIARKNNQRRQANGAVTVQMPEVHITVDKESKKVSVLPDEKYESNNMIQEMMLLAGEGAARFAFKNQIPFPYVSQEAPQFPELIPDGWAGQFARVKCMRKRSVGITPAPHSGLGLSFYSQVTSPLRRYSDLIAHQQLRAFIKGEKILDKDAMLEKVAAGDAASIAAKKASRLSDTHWKLVYLIQNPELEFEGVCIDVRGNDALFLIPQLDMQATIKGCSGVKLNDTARLKADKIDITTQNIQFLRL